MNGRREHFDDDRPSLANARGRHENPTTVGMVGFIAALVSLGFLAVVFVLNTFLKQEEQMQENIERVRWMYIWFIILDLLSFLAGLTATVMCGRGLSPTNPLYRGWSIFGLILGILEMILAIGFGLFMTCAVLMLGMRG